MVAPYTLLKLNAADVGGHRASLAAVEPAIGAPREGVGDAVGVLHPKPAQEHLGISVGHVVAVVVGVEEEIRDIEDEHPAVAECQSRHQIKPVDEITAVVHEPIAIAVFENRDPVSAARTLRRRFGDAIVFGARVPVDLHPFQPSRVGILQVLDDPQSSAVIEFNAYGLADERLRRDDARLEAVCHLHPLDGFLRCQPLSPGGSGVSHEEGNCE